MNNQIFQKQSDAPVKWHTTRWKEVLNKLLLYYNLNDIRSADRHPGRAAHNEE